MGTALLKDLADIVEGNGWQGSFCLLEQTAWSTRHGQLHALGPCREIHQPLPDIVPDTSGVGQNHPSVHSGHLRYQSSAKDFSAWVWLGCWCPR